MNNLAWNYHFRIKVSWEEVSAEVFVLRVEKHNWVFFLAQVFISEWAVQDDGKEGGRRQEEKRGGTNSQREGFND